MILRPLFVDEPIIPQTEEQIREELKGTPMKIPSTGTGVKLLTIEIDPVPCGDAKFARRFLPVGPIYYAHGKVVTVREYWETNAVDAEQKGHADFAATLRKIGAES